ADKNRSAGTLRLGLVLGTAGRKFHDRLTSTIITPAAEGRQAVTTDDLSSTINGPVSIRLPQDAIASSLLSARSQRHYSRRPGLAISKSHDDAHRPLHAERILREDRPALGDLEAPVVTDELVLVLAREGADPLHAAAVDEEIGRGGDRGAVGGGDADIG